LSSSTLVSVTGNFGLQGLLKITVISLPLLNSFGIAFYLDGVPALNALSVLNLSFMETFHLVFAQNLTIVTLNNITYVSSMEINNVGLYSLPSINIDPATGALVILL
jgi:hypothetical protein